MRDINTDNGSRTPSRRKVLSEMGEQGSDTSRRRILKTGGAIATAGLAGCLGGDDGEPTPTEGDDGGRYDVDPDEWPDLEGRDVHIVTQQSSDYMQNYWARAAGAFQQATGALVRMEYTGFAQGIRQRIAQLVQAGSPPELAYVDKLMIPTFAARGLMADHSSLIQDVQDQYGEIFDVTRVKRDGGDRMLPLMTTNMVTWYREDIFDEAPTTWAAQLQQAEKHDDPNGVRGIASILQRGQCSQNNLLTKAYESGARIAGRDSNSEIEIIMDQGSNRDRWIEALEFEKELYQYSNANTDVGCVGNLESLASESGAQTYFVGTRPKDAVADRPFGEDVSVARPQRPDVDDGKHWSVVAGYGAFKDADSEAAMEFLRFMTQPDFFFDFYMDPALMWAPVISEVADDERYHNRLDEHLGDHFKPEDRERMIEIGQNMGQNGIVTAAETSPDNEYTNVIYESFLLADLKFDVVVNDADPGQALDSYAGEIRNLVEETDL